MKLIYVSVVWILYSSTPIGYSKNIPLINFFRYAMLWIFYGLATLDRMFYLYNYTLMEKFSIQAPCSIEDFHQWFEEEIRKEWQGELGDSRFSEYRMYKCKTYKGKTRLRIDVIALVQNLPDPSVVFHINARNIKKGQCNISATLFNEVAYLDWSTFRNLLFSNGIQDTFIWEFESNTYKLQLDIERISKIYRYLDQDSEGLYDPNTQTAEKRQLILEIAAWNGDIYKVSDLEKEIGISMAKYLSLIKRKQEGDPHAEILLEQSLIHQGLEHEVPFTLTKESLLEFAAFFVDSFPQIGDVSHIKVPVIDVIPKAVLSRLDRFLERAEPDSEETRHSQFPKKPTTRINDPSGLGWKLWFDYYHDCKSIGKKYTLKEIAEDNNLDPTYIRQRHSLYKAEHRNNLQNN